MRTTAGVRLDEVGSNIDACTAYFDLFGNMFLDQGVGQTVALSPAMQDQLVDAILERRKTTGERPIRPSGKVISMFLMTWMGLVFVSPGNLHYHCRVKWCHAGSPKQITMVLDQLKLEGSA